MLSSILKQYMIFFFSFLSGLLQNSRRDATKSELKGLYLYYPATVRNTTLWFLFQTQWYQNLKLPNLIDNNDLYTRLTNAWRGSTLVSLHYKWVEPGYIIDHNLLQLLTRKPKLTKYFHEILFSMIWFSKRIRNVLLLLFKIWSLVGCGKCVK